MYRNSEGYPDPVAGAVWAKYFRELREQQRKQYRHNTEIRSRPKVYIVSKYAGDVETNIQKAIRYARFAIKKKKIPVVSHLMYPQILDDGDPKERELGLLFGQSLLALCEEVWVFGKEFSPGMEAEIHEAKRLKKPIKYYYEMRGYLYEDVR